MRRHLPVLVPAAAMLVVTAIICSTWLITLSLRTRQATVLGVLGVPSADVTLPIVDFGDEGQLRTAPGSAPPGDRSVVALTGMCPASLGTALHRGDDLMVGTTGGTLRYVVTAVEPGPPPDAPRPPTDEGVLTVTTCAPVHTVRAMLDPVGRPPSGRG